MSKVAVVAIDEPKLYAEIDAEKSVLMYQWKGHILDEEAEKGFLNLLALIKKHRIANVVADVSKFKGGTVKTAKWVNDHYSEMLRDAKVQKIAVIVPESAFGQFSNMVALGEKTVTLLDVEKFTNIESAYIWFDQ
ncbi:MAG: STAS/SEC14 domain-containing protein [Bacteroidota bacterium]